MHVRTQLTGFEDAYGKLNELLGFDSLLRQIDLSHGCGFRLAEIIPMLVQKRLQSPFSKRRSLFLDAMESGVLYGYPILDVGVTLTGGSSHEIDASELAFRNAATTAFREACRNAKPILLEPVMNLEIVCPSEFVGTVHQQIASRNGRITGSDLRDDIQILKALAPLSQMFGYATDLRSGTQGRGSFSMVFELYDQVAGGAKQ